MQGTRLPDAVMGEPGPGWDAWEGDARPRTVIAPPGAYMKVQTRQQSELVEGRLVDWCWYVRDPLGDVCTIRDNHRVVEHPDGTITVTPSIINPNGSYHGFLRAGVWST